MSLLSDNSRRRTRHVRLGRLRRLPARGRADALMTAEVPADSLLALERGGRGTGTLDSHSQ
jgi:hypothetical protein